jgi:membrane-associated protein
MEFFRKLFHLIFGHLNDVGAWNDMIGYVGHGNIYIVLFAIVFAETGLVVTPFLPGDSLLFAVGAIGAKGVAINLPIITLLLMAAAIAGDAANYWIGYKIGPKVFSIEEEPDWKEPPGPVDGPQLAYEQRKPHRTLAGRLLNKKHLLRAQEFYDRYGGKTIILARFVPVVRTFAPFVAGIGKMNFFRFWIYNIIGGIAWVLACVFAGVFFGKFEFVKKHFELVLIAIVFVSVLPMVFELLKARREARGIESKVEPSTQQHS